MSGATGTLAWFQTLKDGKQFIHLGHVGDSRAIIGAGSSWEKQVVAFGTEDHKCDLPAERARIESKNGVVRQRKGDVPHRVFMKGSQLPGLAMSRSLGDLLASKIGVSHIPDVETYNISSDSQVLVICSDGVWEFLDNEKVLSEIKKYPKEKIQLACENLAKLAWAQWVEVEHDVVDDITVIAVVLEEFRNAALREKAEKADQDSKAAR
jgi:serine/threonine protein phosphatase PrpC